MKIAIVTDSTASLTEAELEALDVYMTPLSVQLNGKTYRDMIDLSPDAFYDLLKQSDSFPTSSQPALGYSEKFYEALAKEYDAILSVCLSSGISGTFSQVFSISQMHPEWHIYPFDSKVTVGMQVFYLKEARRLIDEENASIQEILEQFEDMKQYTTARFVVDDLNNLARGGRLGTTSALLGTLLNVKPILTIENGLIGLSEKVRTTKKAYRRLIEIFAAEVNKGVPLKAQVIHANNLEVAEEIKSQLVVQFPDMEVTIGVFSPVIGTHVGEKSVGIAWTKDYLR